MGKKPLQLLCSTLTIQEEGQSLAKSYTDLIATLEGGELYIDNKYRFRMKQMTALKIADIEINATFDNKGKITLVQLNASSQIDVVDWQDFCKRCSAYFEKIQSKERKTGFGTGSLKATSRKAMPWDDVTRRGKSNKKTRPMTYTPVKQTAAVVSSQKERPSTPPPDDMLTEKYSSEKSIERSVEDDLDNDSSVKAADKELIDSDDDDIVPKIIKKKRRIQRKTIFDEEDSDEDIFTEKIFTTPATSNHIVSPGTVRNKDSLEDESSEGEAEFDDPLKNQSQISSFFAPAKRLTPPHLKQVLTPAMTPTKSPQATSSARKAIFTSTGKHGVSQRALDIVNATKHRKKTSFDSTSWLQNSQTKKAKSSAEKRHLETLVPSHKELASDPIVDASTPLLSTAAFSPKRWRRNILSKRRRESSKGTKTSMNHPKLLESAVPIEPELPRFRGLRNLGNTCYMNASLQMLFTCRDFMAALQQARGGELIQSVCGIYRELQCPDMMAAKPTMIKNAIDKKTDKFLGFEQRDAHEFLADLIDHMDEEIKKETGENDDATRLPTDDFCLTVRAHLTCTSCGYSRYVVRWNQFT